MMQNDDLLKCEYELNFVLNFFVLFSDNFLDENSMEIYGFKIENKTL
jgi:hypothetical protein